MRWATVAVVCAVLIAGCSGVDSAGGDDATPTVTPAPVDEVITTAQPTPTGSYLPGVTGNGSVDTDALLTAHEAALANTSYTWAMSYNRTVPGENRTLESFTRRVAVADGGDFAVSIDRPGGLADRVIYADGTGGYIRVFDDGSAEANRTIPSPDPWYYVTTADHVAVYLSAAESSVATLERGGQRYYRLHVTSPPEPVATRHPGGSVSNYTATAYVTPDGFVRSLAVEYNVTFDDRTTHVTARIDHSRVGATTVEWPDWAAELRETSRDIVRTAADPNATAVPSEPTATVRPVNGTATPDSTPPA